MQCRVVAHLLDGALIKGTSLAVESWQPTCQIRTAAGMVNVDLSSVKALFIVRDLVGNDRRQDRQMVDLTDPALGGNTLIEVLFQDGERLLGLTEEFPPQGQFYFLAPLDNGSNNLKILVNRAATLAVTVHDLHQAA